jgi:D-alanyl-D-alanine carboxypeptidase
VDVARSTSRALRNHQPSSGDEDKRNKLQKAVREAGHIVRAIGAGSIWILILLPAILELTGCGSSASGSGEDVAVQAKLQTNLNDYLKQWGDPEHFSAMSLSVNLGGAASNIEVAAGTTQYGGTTAVTPWNLFQIGSITKSFTAAAILQLEAEGKLSIHDTVGHWLPQYSAWSKVTLQQLLNMTSGIPTYDQTPEFLEQITNHPNTHFAAAELVAYVDPAQGSTAQPTTGYSYSNTNYILVQMIVEAASASHSYASEIQRRFIAPLGLSNTFYDADAYPAAVMGRLVAGYAPDLDYMDISPYSLSWAQGAGGIIANPEDVTKWVRTLYAGEVLAPAQLQELKSVVSTATGKPISQASANDPLAFGLGVFQSYNAELGGAVWCYEGSTLGYRVLYYWLPLYDTVIAVGANSHYDGKPPLDELLQTVFETLRAAGKI